MLFRYFYEFYNGLAEIDMKNCGNVDTSENNSNQVVILGPVGPINHPDDADILEEFKWCL